MPYTNIRYISFGRQAQFEKFAIPILVLNGKKVFNLDCRLKT